MQQLEQFSIVVDVEVEVKDNDPDFYASYIASFPSRMAANLYIAGENRADWARNGGRGFGRRYTVIDPILGTADHTYCATLRWVDGDGTECPDAAIVEVTLGRPTSTVLEILGREIDRYLTVTRRNGKDGNWFVDMVWCRPPVNGIDQLATQAILSGAMTLQTVKEIDGAGMHLTTLGPAWDVDEELLADGTVKELPVRAENGRFVGKS